MDLPSSGDTNPTPSPQAPATIGSLPDELLLAMLGGLSVTDRARVRRVSKKWNDLVMDLGIHHEPLFVDDQLGIPFYSGDITIRQNFHAWDPDSDSLTRIWEADLPNAKLTRSGDSIPIALHMYRSEFLTFPPIRTLALHVIM